MATSKTFAFGFRVWDRLAPLNCSDSPFLLLAEGGGLLSASLKQRVSRLGEMR